ncbi:MAG: hypothetical protein L0332_29535 [Chloroflexi bacterium]|nr:hypothetical protein [Chloroflexota bacterium]MCI0647533.1 hypothetical protein [Chloroflexota bacterium]MCI0730844.1 hypothetical protein [Chloroflexota bacterium]
MARCDYCGNEYDKTFEVTLGGNNYTFDSFECAIQLVAPACNHCGVKVIGHGLEMNGAIYCCDHCARKEGIELLRDRA